MGHKPMVFECSICGQFLTDKSGGTGQAPDGLRAPKIMNRHVPSCASVLRLLVLDWRWCEEECQKRHGYAGCCFVFGPSKMNMRQQIRLDKLMSAKREMSTVNALLVAGGEGFRRSTCWLEISLLF